MHLEPNKIHHLPVRITYTLPAISSEPPLLYATGFPCAARQGPSPHVTYTTTTRGLVPVFVHDVRESGSHRRKRRKIVVVNKGEEEEEEEESEGGREQKATVCLKSVVRAICLASPEIIPLRRTSDLKIYLPTTTAERSSSRQGTRARRVSIAPTTIPPGSTPSLTSSRTRPSSSSMPASECEMDIKPHVPFTHAGYQPPPFSKPAVVADASPHPHPHPRHGWPSSSSPFVTHHPHLMTPRERTARLPAVTPAAQQILQPKSTIAAVLGEKGTGKTTVTGLLTPCTSDMLDSVLDDGDGVSGLDALESLLRSPVEAVLDVRLVLEAPVVKEHSLDPERESAVYDALGLVHEAASADHAIECAGHVEMASEAVKVEPDWVDSSSTVHAEHTTEPLADPTTTHPPTAAAVAVARPAFRPFRPTTSKMAIFQSQTQRRKHRNGTQGRRGYAHGHPPGSSGPDPSSPSSQIFSRTRSRTRTRGGGMGGGGAGGGTTMLEQVVNVDHVVRLARKNPAALVDRLYAGRPATSPVKARAGGVSIDSKAPMVGGGGGGGVKTLNIATGSSKKRKVVSVVLDDEGRPVRWGAGIPAATTATVASGDARGGEVGTQGRAQGATSAANPPGVNDKPPEPEPVLHFGRNLPICSNCGITESSSWRTKGKGGQRVCNACGLYWNNKGKMRPKELWEKDIARWKKRRAKAAEKSANATTSTATATPVPVPAATVIKSEPVSARRLSVPIPIPSAEVVRNSLNLAVGRTTTHASLKRNLSAMAEKEAQLRADQRKTHAAGSRTEQLASDKENVHDRRRVQPCLPTPPGNATTAPAHRTATSALQPLDTNAKAHASIPLLQQIKESPEAVLKRYLGETPFSLVPADHMPLSDDGSRGSRAHAHTRSPAASPTEVGSVRHSQEDPIEWGTASDLAGLFRFSQQAESVVSLATTAHHPQEHRVSHTEADVGGHLGSDEFTMMDVDDAQINLMQPEHADLAGEEDPFAAELAAAPYSTGSSPARQPFDWKDLPPSSPPVMYDDEVDHAAALWSSSPETSPVDFGTISVKEVSPMKPVGEDMQNLLQSLEQSAQAEALRLINESA